MSGRLEVLFGMYAGKLVVGDRFDEEFVKYPI